MIENNEKILKEINDNILSFLIDNYEQSREKYSELVKASRNKKKISDIEFMKILTLEDRIFVLSRIIDKYSKKDFISMEVLKW